MSFIRGLQGNIPDHPRTIATPKHFAVHSGPEPGRHSFDVDVSAYDLEATYTPAFRAAIVDGHAGSVMCAYNALHGTPACASDWLLNTRLRNDWGFNGFVVSDCDAIEDMTRFHFFRQDNASASAAALKSGDDLNCGNTYRDLNQAIARGDIDESTLDQALIRLLHRTPAPGYAATTRARPLCRHRHQAHRYPSAPRPCTTSGRPVTRPLEKLRQHTPVNPRDHISSPRPGRRLTHRPGSQLPRHLLDPSDPTDRPTDPFRHRQSPLCTRRLPGTRCPKHHHGNRTAQPRSPRPERGIFRHD